MTVQLQPPNRLVNPPQVPNLGLDLGASQPVVQQPGIADPSQLQFNNFDLQQLLQQQVSDPPIAPNPPQPIGAGVQGVEQYMQQFSAPYQDTNEGPQIVRRNLTVAEMLVVFVLSCFFVGGVQIAWSYLPKPVISIEWRS